MTRRLELVALGSAPEDWQHGSVHVADHAPASIARASEAAVANAPDAVLWWDPSLGSPPDLVGLLDEPDDVWHAGLVLGQAGRPGRLAGVAPAWMLGADPPHDLEATSWRLSMRACLARRAVLESIGGPDPAFDTVSGCSLELGHRWITHGARMRHRPDLLGSTPPVPDDAPTQDDELRLIERRLGRQWALFSAATGRSRFRSMRRAARLAQESRPQVDDLVPDPCPAPTDSPTVSVVIPTIDRYQWLDTVLGQLARQTLRPHDVIVVDQTTPERRRAIRQDDLPLTVIVREQPGQSSARNAALAAANSDLVLFIDDDDEIDDDLLESHAAVIEHRRVDVSSGTAHEPGDGEPTAEFRRFRTADVFPTNNTMLRREVLARSGGFDLAFDHGIRADHDLGTRLYLAGARMVLSPDIDVLHHRAPSGGLRTADARRVTAASSRGTLTSRQPLASTEVYLWRQHHPDAEARAVALRLLGNLRGAGSGFRRTLRALIQVALMPAALRQARAARREADALCETHPTIPRFEGAS